MFFDQKEIDLEAAWRLYQSFVEAIEEVIESWEKREETELDVDTLMSALAAITAQHAVLSGVDEATFAINCLETFRKVQALKTQWLETEGGEEEEESPPSVEEDTSLN
jgi:hypothetical protein